MNDKNKGDIMARPIKKGLYYFPFDTDFFENRKIRRLIQQYGAEGVGTYMATLCKMYGTDGCYASYSLDLCSDIAFALKVDEVRVAEILKFCVEIGLFDAKLFHTKQLLTSKGIQERYALVNKRYLQIIPSEIALYDVNNLNFSAIMGKITPTKEKEKEIKRKKREIKYTGKTIKMIENDKIDNTDADEARGAELRKMLEAAKRGG